MKKLRIAVAALVIAAGSFAAFAFSNADKTVEKETKFATTYYILNESTEMYEKISGTTPPPLSNCEPGADHRCVIGFSSDQGNSLDPESLPATPDYQSPSNGYYVP